MLRGERVNNIRVWRVDEISVVAARPTMSPMPTAGRARLRQLDNAPLRRVRPIRIEEFPSIDAHRRRIRSYLQVVSNVVVRLNGPVLEISGLSPLSLFPFLPPPLFFAVLRRNGRATTTPRAPRGNVIPRRSPAVAALRRSRGHRLPANADSRRRHRRRRRRSGRELPTAVGFGLGSPTTI